MLPCVGRLLPNIMMPPWAIRHHDAADKLGCFSPRSESSDSGTFRHGPSVTFRRPSVTRGCRNGADPPRGPLLSRSRGLWRDARKSHLQSHLQERLAERRGNRTHPRRDHRRTAVLKTGPATRPDATPRGRPDSSASGQPTEPVALGRRHRSTPSRQPWARRIPPRVPSHTRCRLRCQLREGNYRAKRERRPGGACG